MRHTRGNRNGRPWIDKRQAGRTGKLNPMNRHRLLMASSLSFVGQPGAGPHSGVVLAICFAPAEPSQRVVAETAVPCVDSDNDTVMVDETDDADTLMLDVDSHQRPKSPTLQDFVRLSPGCGPDAWYSAAAGAAGLDAVRVVAWINLAGGGFSVREGEGLVLHDEDRGDRWTGSVAGTSARSERGLVPFRTCS